MVGTEDKYILKVKGRWMEATLWWIVLGPTENREYLGLCNGREGRYVKDGIQSE